MKNPPAPSDHAPGLNVPREHGLLSAFDRRPDRGGSWWGLALRRRLRAGSPAERILRLRDEVFREPSCAPAHLLLGRELASAGRLEEAVFALRQSALSGRSWKAWRHLSEVLRQLERHDVAEEAARAALARRPHDAASLTALGLVLLERDQPADAVRVLRQAVRHAPRRPASLAALGRAHLACGRPLLAWRALREASGQDPGDALILCHLAGACEALCRPDAAGALYERAVALDPELAEARFGQGLLRLRLGDFENGWKGYEWRLRLRKMVRRSVGLAHQARSRWHGEPFPGRSLLVTTEQGSGDIFQCVRFLPAVRARGGTVRLVCRPEHRRLFRGQAGVDEIVETRAAGEGSDLRISLLSVPAALGIGAGDLPGPVPYIHPDPELVRAFAARIAGDRGPRVGLVWAGNPQHQGDRFRSIAFPALAPLLQVPGIRFYSLQKTPATARERVPASRDQATAGSSLRSLSEHLGDFGDTAAAIACLDLVISVDTSVAHLAGAMGARVWTLIPVHSDWRWPLRGSSTPWYPTMTVFRQRRTGNWTGTIDEVAGALIRARDEGTFCSSAGKPTTAEKAIGA